jgi:hypothetical protein
VGVVLVGGPLDGVAHDDPYVRRFWVAAIGPGAVADLLRLIAAANAGRPIPRPLYLAALGRVGLARSLADHVVVPLRVPVLPAHLLGRLPAGLRDEHRRWLQRRSRG